VIIYIQYSTAWSPVSWKSRKSWETKTGHRQLKEATASFDSLEQGWATSPVGGAGYGKIKSLAGQSTGSIP